VLEKTTGWFCGKPWFNTEKTTRATRRMPYRQDIGSLGWGEKGGGEGRMRSLISNLIDQMKNKKQKEMNLKRSQIFRGKK
jgi:hypothetical protein